MNRKIPKQDAKSIKSNSWTRNEEIIVFNLYCKIPFQRSSKNHPEVIKIANLINRTPSAVNMKIGNFGSFDTALKAKGIVGLTNVSKLDKEIWDEFNGKWDELAFLSEKLIADMRGERIDDIYINEFTPRGTDRIATVKQRVNQAFFRSTILSSYHSACCITGINNKELLIASHIKPWKDSSSSEKTNPRNGLCLNSLHDRAFDRGFITVTPDFKIHISNNVSDICGGITIDKFFKSYDSQTITIPEKFVPDKEFLQYHNDVIYENWK